MAEIAVNWTIYCTQCPFMLILDPAGQWQSGARGSGSQGILIIWMHHRPYVIVCESDESRI
jgi:hypothetical protein